MALPSTGFLVRFRAVLLCKSGTDRAAGKGQAVLAGSQRPGAEGCRSKVHHRVGDHPRQLRHIVGGGASPWFFFFFFFAASAPNAASQARVALCHSTHHKQRNALRQALHGQRLLRIAQLPDIGVDPAVCAGATGGSQRPLPAVGRACAAAPLGGSTRWAAWRALLVVDPARSNRPAGDCKPASAAAHQEVELQAGAPPLHARVARAAATHAQNAIQPCVPAMPMPTPSAAAKNMRIKNMASKASACTQQASTSGGRALHRARGKGGGRRRRRPPPGLVTPGRAHSWARPAQHNCCLAPQIRQAQRWAGPAGPPAGSGTAMCRGLPIRTFVQLRCGTAACSSSVTTGGAIQVGVGAG